MLIRSRRRLVAIVAMAIMLFAANVDAGICARSVVFTNTSGVITDGPGNYADVMQCKWILSAPAGNYISLYVDSFNTECGWDFLWIYDGLNETTVPILATFSGLQTSIDPIVSSSNQVSVFFNADAAMNASGFSIRYAFSPCPFNCSDIGVCQMPSRTCSCPVGYDGVGCEKKNCITTGCVNGVCDALSGKCACNATFHGSDCSLGLLQPAWLPMAVNPSSPPRQMLASGGLYIPQIDSVLSIGGLVNGRPSIAITIYRFSDNTWHSLPTPSIAPSPRYGHTLVNIDGDNVLMFGGRGSHVRSNELWKYTVSTNTFQHLNQSGAVPPPVWGHVAIFDPSRRVMIVHGGQNDRNTVSRLFQWYHVDNATWTAFNADRKLNEISVVPALMHATAIYDASRDRMLIFGGDSDAGSQYMDQALSYSIGSNYFSYLTTSSEGGGIGRMLHSAVLVGDMVVLLGGYNADACASHDLVVYSVLANRFLKDKVAVFNDKSIRSHLDRIGTTLVARPNGSLYAFGGFSHVATRQTLELHHDRCAWHTSNITCTSRDGCLWRADVGYCFETDPLSPSTHVIMFDSAVAPDTCALAQMRSECVSLSPRCDWCASTATCMPSGNIGASCVSNDTCLAITNDGGAIGCGTCSDAGHVGNTTCTWCHANQACQSDALACMEEPSASRDVCVDECAAMTSCGDCLSTQTANCTWCGASRTCQRPESSCSTDRITDVDWCVSNCAMHDSCVTCTQMGQGCLWCDNLEECLPSSLWQPMYPYGQCRKWFSNGVCSMPSNPTLAPPPTSPPPTSPPMPTSTVTSSPSAPTSVPTATATVPANPTPPTPPLNCTCHGHADYCEMIGTTNLQCVNCRDDTKNGALGSCELCRDGFYGAPMNGGVCWFVLGTGQSRGRDDVVPSQTYTYSRTISTYSTMAIFFESEMGRASLYISTVSPMPNRTHNEYVVTGRTVNGPIVLRAGDRTEWFFSITSTTTTPFTFYVEDYSNVTNDVIDPTSSGLLFYLIIFFLSFFGLLFLSILIVKLRQIAQHRTVLVQQRPRPFDMTMVAPMIKVRMTDWKPTHNLRINATNVAIIKREMEGNVIALTSIIQLPSDRPMTDGLPVLDASLLVGQTSYVATSDGPLFVDPEHLDELKGELVDRMGEGDSSNENVVTNQMAGNQMAGNQVAGNAQLANGRQENGEPMGARATLAGMWRRL